jgi:hypothetical protein
MKNAMTAAAIRAAAPTAEAIAIVSVLLFFVAVAPTTPPVW